MCGGHWSPSEGFVMTKLKFNGARKTDPHTSHESAEESKELSETLAERVADLALAAGTAGITSYEAADAMGVSIVSVSPVIKPLIELGLLFRRVIGHKKNGKEIYETRINQSSGHPVAINFHHTVEKKQHGPATATVARTENYANPGPLTSIE
jgi:DNA-binding transcriptional MocR family regulator